MRDKQKTAKLTIKIPLLNQFFWYCWYSFAKTAYKKDQKLYFEWTRYREQELEEVW